MSKKHITLIAAALVVIGLIYSYGLFSGVFDGVSLLPSEAQRVAVLESLSAASSSISVSQAERRDLLRSLEMLSTAFVPPEEEKMRLLDSLGRGVY